MADWRELRKDAPKPVEGIAEIPSGSIIKWMRFKQIPDDQQEFYYAVITTIDSGFIEYKWKHKNREVKRNKLQRSAFN